MADVYGLPTGCLPYTLLYSRLKDEAESKHNDAWVTTISLGSVRTLVTAMEMLDNLQHLVTEDLIMHSDGVIEEVTKFHVEHCGQCDLLRLRTEDGSDE